MQNIKLEVDSSSQYFLKKIRIGLIISYSLLICLGIFIFFSCQITGLRVMNAIEIFHHAVLILSLFTKNTPLKQASVLTVLLFSICIAIVMVFINEQEQALSLPATILLSMATILRFVLFYAHYRFMQIKKDLRKYDTRKSSLKSQSFIDF